MNKYNLEKSLRTIRDADLALSAKYQEKARQSAPVSPVTRTVKPIPVRRQPLPNEFPPGMHPDDWEPDDEGDRGPVVSQFPASSRDAPFIWSDDF